jgi:aminoglycoside phosphotransferase (APT) family kinase protein
MSEIPNFDAQLPEGLLRWVIDTVDPQAVARAVRRLPGATSSTLHRVTLQVGPDVRDYVVRRFDNLEWLAEEPDLARHEAASLDRAARTGLPVPRLIAYDETGQQAGGLPLVLMSFLPGAVVLRPPNPERWLTGLAAALVRIHALNADDFPWAYFSYADLTALEVPAWSTHPAAWRAAIKRLEGPPPAYQPCFIHRDFHPANVLWGGENAISGVVDWPNACRGPRGVDLGHCRVNLAQMFGVPTAQAFLAAYRRLAGPDFHYDPYWDLLALVDILSGPPEVYPGWPAHGLTGLTDRLMAERLDAYLLEVVGGEGRRT